MIPSNPLPELYESPDEKRFVAEMNHHLWLSRTAQQVCAFRDLPMWLMAANAIVWNGSGVRLPVIGGPQTPWHWGAFLACGNRLGWLIPIVYFNPLANLWKVAAAATATLTILWPIAGIAHGEAETFYTLFEEWEKGLSKALEDEILSWQYSLGTLNVKQLSTVVKRAKHRRKLFALCPFNLKRLKSASPNAAVLQLIHLLDIACELDRVDQKLVNDAIEELSSEETPKTLSDRKWRSETAKRDVKKRNELLTLIKVNENELKTINDRIKHFRIKLEKLLKNPPIRKNGKIRDPCMKLVHDSIQATKRVTELLTQVPSDEYATLNTEWKEIKKLWWKDDNNLYSYCDNVCHLEWPGSSLDVYGEKFVLAHCFQDKEGGALRRMIKALKSGKLSPRAFYDLVGDHVMEDEPQKKPQKSSWKYREVRFGAVAAVARSKMVPS